MGIVDNALMGASGQGGYFLSRSLRFRSSASAYLNRTFSSGDQVLWTWSAWVKRGTLGTYQVLFGRQVDGNTIGTIGFDSDKIAVNNKVGGSTGGAAATNAVFRDPSAWYHIVVAYNGNGSAATDKFKIYVNSVLQTFSSTENYSTGNGYINANLSYAIGRRENLNDSYFDGYMTEINFIGGQALTPSSFGSTNTLTGVWQPARYVGAYGTNGFYLPFTDNSALTTSSNVGLGKDFSGNGNYWTTNNISITSGVTYDSMTDVPTLTSATAANFAVLNPLDCDSLSTGSVTNGNLAWAGSYVSKNGHPIRSTFRTPSSGKWYTEARNVTVSGGGNSLPLGFTTSTQPIASASIFAGTINTFIGVDASVFNNNVRFRTTGVSASLADATTLFATYASGDVVNLAIDLSAGKFWAGKNGTWYNSGDPAAGTNATSTFTVGSDAWTFLTEYVSSGDNGNRSSAVLNFGQQGFSNTPPSGFVALNTFNLPTSTIVKGNTSMNAVTWSGASSGTNLNVTGFGFQPDFVWGKNRSGTYDHFLQDSVRGITNGLSSNLTAAQSITSGSPTSFISDGFNISSTAGWSSLGNSNVTWAWKESASAGFDIVTFTGNGGSQTFAHGLGVPPGLMICKSLNNAQDWYVYHSSIGGTGALLLNSTVGTQTSVNYWANVTPGSGTFSVGPNFSNGYTYVNYLFAPIAGYSAFGSAVGNGTSDNVFVYLGFRPKFLLVKRSDGLSDWVTIDSSRDPYNVAVNLLNPNLNGAEYTSGVIQVDFLSNGFKVRGSWGGFTNFIYACFAENPFKNALAR